MEQHFNKYWIHYFVGLIILGILFVWLAKKINDNRDTSGDTAAILEGAVLNENKMLSTGMVNNEVLAAQFYINNSFTQNELPFNPILEDGNFSQNLVNIIDEMRAYSDGEIWDENPRIFITTTLTEVKALTDNFNYNR